MADAAKSLKVFVSYSRTDVEFADQLVLALQDRGFEPILDRHDMSGGENWRERLGKLILSADAVTFILTAKSAASEICAWEVDEAARLASLNGIATEHLAAAGFAMVDPAPVEGQLAEISSLRGCNGCELRLGRALDAEHPGAGHGRELDRGLAQYGDWHVWFLSWLLEQGRPVALAEHLRVQRQRGLYGSFGSFESPAGVDAIVRWAVEQPGGLKPLSANDAAVVSRSPGGIAGSGASIIALPIVARMPLRSAAANTASV